MEEQAWFLYYSGESGCFVYIIAEKAKAGWTLQAHDLSLSFILSHRQAKDYFARLGDDPSNQAFTTRRGIYFSHNRASIGLACAQATAASVYLPAYQPQRHPPPPPPQGNLDNLPSLSYHPAI